MQQFWKKMTGAVFLLLGSVSMYALEYTPETVKATLSVKVPGNPAKVFPLRLERQGSNGFQWVSDASLPVTIRQQVENVQGRKRITVRLTARETLYFNFGEEVETGYSHKDCLFYMPGFWYRRNLRSPKEAPSFYTSDSWTVREDRLSTPLTAVYDSKSRKATSVIRLADYKEDALTAHKEGEVILSGRTSIGYTGFRNEQGFSSLVFGFPYKEEPKSYVRKLTLAPSVEAFEKLGKGESLTLSWEIGEVPATDFSDCVRKMWEYSFDSYQPKPLPETYSSEKMKAVMSNYFVQSFVGDRPLNFFSSPEMLVATCNNKAVAEVGFVGRTLLNAFNALEYGEQQKRPELVTMANRIFDSYLKNGFSDNGFFQEAVNYNRPEERPVYSIRRQSEGVYALLYYLAYERQQGRRHLEWEKRVRTLLGQFLRLQNKDGSFPRKFEDNLSVIDKSGGSTPSATLPLVMGYVYFHDRQYLESAIRTVNYLEREIISKSDYFSSTLDANCEDKEASLYAATAAYYLALVTKGKEQERYAELARKAAYFALSWYYTWDVPFAEGQMLGDIGLKTRGWGNVSVENNHIDVFVFDFADVLRWLAERYNEPRFTRFSEVISTSMRQLLPFEGHMCGVGKAGFYPEVVQHTNWDYGRNGKGFYNDIFAPGWTVASLWELLSPGRAEAFIGPRSQVVAHRGFWNCPGSAQNSLQSLRLADKIGVYGSEFDVHITTDGVPVINHNDEIDGIRIDDEPYKAIAGKRLKNGELLPTLQQYLEEAQKHPRLRLILEIKAHNTEAKEKRCVDSVLSIVRRMGLLDRINFTSFSMYACTYLRQQAPSAVILYLGGKLSPAELKAKGLSGMNYSPAEFEAHPDWIEQAHQLGLKVGVWTMDRLDLVSKFVKEKADFISSNSPDKAEEVVERLQKN